MKLSSLILEMANVTISSPGEPSIDAYVSQGSNVQGRHWKRIKIAGPNNTTGVVTWGSNKRPIGNLTQHTINEVNDFIRNYQLLLDALWDEIIDHDEFRMIYNDASTQGTKIISSRIKAIQQAKKNPPVP